MGLKTKVAKTVLKHAVKVCADRATTPVKVAAAGAALRLLRKGIETATRSKVSGA